MRSTTNTTGTRRFILGSKTALVALAILFLTIQSGNSLAAVVRVAFDPSTDERVVGYNLYYGVSENFDTSIDLGTGTSCEISELTPGATYYIAATGYDQNGNESAFSDTISYSVPVQDSDGDGVADADDLCPLDPQKVEPGFCGCGVADTDSDFDGEMDCNDLCPTDSNKIEPGTCGCGVADVDSDGDGTADCYDQCPGDPSKTLPGDCGCGMTENDSDSDGTADCMDLCPLDPNKTEPGAMGCGVLEDDGESTCSADFSVVFDPSPDERVVGYKLYYGLSEDFQAYIDLGPNTSHVFSGLPAGKTFYFAATGYDDSENESGFSEILTYHVELLDTDADGISNCDDLCPSNPDKSEPGLCGCDVADTDSDGDGILDCVDECPVDPNKTIAGTCGCGISDTDSDNDGTVDCNDLCPSDPNKTVPGSCGCGIADADLDSDGVADCSDQCPSDPYKTEVGICGCGEVDTDTDGDGAYDCNDLCPLDPDKTEPGLLGCGVPEDDGSSNCTAAFRVEFDASPDERVVGYNLYYGLSEDLETKIDLGANTSHLFEGLKAGYTYYFAAASYDATGNESDLTEIITHQVLLLDADGDGMSDCEDLCPTNPDKTEPGTCGCELADLDSDNDGIFDCNDECPEDPYKTTAGICGCGSVDEDSDGDGIFDCQDSCPIDPNKTLPGTCGCGYADADSDNDGLADCEDLCPSDPNKTDPGTCGCGIADADSDNDGIPDCNDSADTDLAQIIQTGEVLVDHNWLWVSFDQYMETPVVVANVAGSNDSEPATVRIRNIDQAGFEIRIQEYEYQDGVHGFETVSYIAMEKGSYILPGDILLEAGTFESKGTLSAHSFEQPFNVAPILIASVTTINEEDAVVTRIKDIDLDGFSHLLQEQENTQTTHYVAETVSYIAWEPSSGTLGNMTFEVDSTGNTVTHKFQYVPCLAMFEDAPFLFAEMQGIAGGDTCNLRYRNKNYDGFEIKVAEEQSANTETNHVKENVGYIMLSFD